MALRRWGGWLCAVLSLQGAQFGAGPVRASDDPAAARVEARTDSLLAVGIAQGDRLSIHVTRLMDNAAVRDAVVTVVLRGTSHPAVAEADGGYSVQTPDLALPGDAVVEIQVAQGSVGQTLKGTLAIAQKSVAQDGNNARQLWWWVLNFAVCIGFLMLWSRRRKTASSD